MALVAMEGMFMMSGHGPVLHMRGWEQIREHGRVGGIRGITSERWRAQVWVRVSPTQRMIGKAIRG